MQRKLRLITQQKKGYKKNSFWERDSKVRTTLGKTKSHKMSVIYEKYQLL